MQRKRNAPSIGLDTLGSVKTTPAFTTRPSEQRSQQINNKLNQITAQKGPEVAQSAKAALQAQLPEVKKKIKTPR